MRSRLGAAASSRRARCACVWLFAAFCAPLLVAQEAPEPPPVSADPATIDPAAGEPFFDTLEVYVVDLDVVVTDRQGRAVAGLGAGDFEVLEDGEPVELVSFTAIAPAAPTVPAPVAPPVAERSVLEGPLSGIEPATAEPAGPAPETTTLAVLVDDLHLSFRDRTRWLDDLGPLLGEILAPTDQVMVMRFDGELQARLEPTPVSHGVPEALTTVAQGSSRGDESAGEHRRLLAEITTVIDAARGQQAAELVRLQAVARAHLAAIEGYAQERAYDARRSVAAVREAVALLAAMPGRKVLLYLGSDFSLRPGAQLYAAWQVAAGELGLYLPSAGAFEGLEASMAGDLDKVAAYANASRVTVHALGSGQSALARWSAEVHSSDLGAREVSRPELFGLGSQERSTALAVLSEATGGYSTVDGFDLLASALRSRLGAYYSLAYSPDRPRDHDPHRVEVKVSRAGLRARHRQRIHDLEADEGFLARTKSALLVPEPANPLAIGLELGPPESGGQEGYDRIQAQVSIPLSRLVLKPSGSVHEGRIAVYVGARDTLGRLSEIRGRRVPIRIPNSELLERLGQFGTITLPLELRRGEQTVAVGVRDEVAGVDSFVRVSYPEARP